MTDYTLSEFKAWCEGKGRGGPTAGRHCQALEAIQRFKLFKAAQATEENDNVEHTAIESTVSSGNSGTES